MAYEKQEWKNGDIITSEKLNHMEDGIAQGGGGDAGYVVERSTQLWLSETSISYGNEIPIEASAIIEDPNEIVDFSVDITFDGVIYHSDYATYDSASQTRRGYHWDILDNGDQVLDIGYYWLETNPSAPFWVLRYPDNETVHTVKIERTTTNVTVTDDFRDAVLYVVNNQ